MLNCIAVGAGGFIGTVLRYLIGLIPYEPSNGFPIKTFCINIIGSFVIGMIAAIAARRSCDPRLVLFLKVGICGGFTTFSSFALETGGLIEKGCTPMAAAYALLSTICGVGAVFIAEKLTL